MARSAYIGAKVRQVLLHFTFLQPGVKNVLKKKLVINQVGSNCNVPETKRFFIMLFCWIS